MSSRFVADFRHVVLPLTFWFLSDFLLPFVFVSFCRGNHLTSVPLHLHLFPFASMRVSRVFVLGFHLPSERVP